MSSVARPLLQTAKVAGLLFLAAQMIVAVGHSMAGTRLAFYTPYSGQTAYRLNVSIAGRPLSDAQIRTRYGLTFRGHTQLTPEALQRIVIDREGSSSTAAAGELFVRLHTSRQGGPEEIWLWPQH
jgi:hypothetical protein